MKPRRAVAALAAVAAVAIAVPGLLPVSSAADPTCSRPGGFTRVGDWRAAKGPTFVEHVGGGGQDISTYAVDPTNPQRAFVTNGTSVVKSLDGGCTWSEVFSLPDTPDDVTPFAASTTRLTELVIPEDVQYREALFVLAQESTEAGGRPHVLFARSAKRGTFEVRDSGLPPAGRGHDLTVGVANSDFAYVAVDSVNVRDDDLGGAVAAPLGGLYASTNGGSAWTQRTPLTEQHRYDLLAVDPGSGNALWAVEGGHLRHSKDGGRTFAAPAPTEDAQTAAGWAFTALTVDRPPRHGPIVHAYSRTSSSGKPVEVVLDSDGARVTAAPAPGPVETAATGFDAATTLVSTRAEGGRPARVHVRVPGGTWADITPTRTTRDLQVSTDRSGQPQVRVVTARAVLTYAKQVVPPPPPLPPVGSTVPDPGLPRPVGPASLLPARTTLSLQSDEARSVTYALRLPHRRVPLDLYFLVDSSESMTDEMPGVRRDAAALVAALRRAGVDVWAGLGYYKTDCRTPAYRRELAVGPTDDPSRLTRALAALDTSDSPGLETQLFALDQSVTGSGAPVVPPPPTDCGVPAGLPESSVPAGQDAGYREAALKVVLHVADITFRRPWCSPNRNLGCTPPQLTPTTADGYPDPGPAAAAFRERGVKAIGIAAEPDGIADLRTFSRLTGTVAPSGGVDCDGNGHSDLAAGAPLVCGSAAHLADPLRRMLGEVAVVRGLALTTSGGVISAARSAVSRVDVTRDLATTVAVTYSCKGRSPGTYPAGLSAALTGGPAEQLGRVQAAVTCLARPLLPLLAPPAVALVPPLPPPGVPPAPVPPVVNPAPGTQPQVQVQTQVQPQVQVGAQQEEELALAVALNDLAPAQEEQVRIEPMSRRDDVPPPAYLLSVAAVTAAASLVAVRRRAAVQVLADDR